MRNHSFNSHIHQAGSCPSTRLEWMEPNDSRSGLRFQLQKGAFRKWDGRDGVNACAFFAFVNLFILFEIVLALFVVCYWKMGVLSWHRLEIVCVVCSLYNIYIAAGQTVQWRAWPNHWPSFIIPKAWLRKQRKQ